MRVLVVATVTSALVAAMPWAATAGAGTSRVVPVAAFGVAALTATAGVVLLVAGRGRRPLSRHRRARGPERRPPQRAVGPQRQLPSSTGQRASTGRSHIHSQQGVPSPSPSYDDRLGRSGSGVSGSDGYATARARRYSDPS